MENVFLQLTTVKNESFCLPASTIRSIAKIKTGTRIYVEDYDFYDVLNEYGAILKVLAGCSCNVLFVPLYSSDSKL